MRTFGRLSMVAIIAILSFVAFNGGTASAGVRFNVDVLWNPNPDDGAQVFLHATNEAYPMPRERVTPIFHEIPDPYNEYPVLAFMAVNAHVDIGTVWAYRKHGHSWANVMFHFGVPPSALFCELPQPPGPPYGKAYGYWRKRGNRMTAEDLSGDDIRYWVRMRTMAGYAGVPPGQVYRWQASGQRYDGMAMRTYKEKHGRGQGHDDQGGNQGHGKGWGKGNAKGHWQD